jgi:hypothetical protein
MSFSHCSKFASFMLRYLVSFFAVRHEEYHQSSDQVESTRSTRILTHADFLNPSGLYALVDGEFDSIAPILQDCMDASITANRFHDNSILIKSGASDLTGRDVFKTLTTFLFEYVA